jgi:hypothetical protein
MLQRIWRGLGVVLLALGMGPALPRAGADGQTVVRVLPPRGTYPLDVDIPVELWVDDVEGLYGVDIQLSFDPSRVAVVEAQVVPGYDLLWPDLIVINKVDNNTGTIQYVAVQLNPRPPASGSGALFSFTCHTLSAGSAETSITAADLSDIDGMLIDRTTEDARYWLGDLQIFLPLVMRSHLAGAVAPAAPEK